MLDEEFVPGLVVPAGPEVGVTALEDRRMTLDAVADRADDPVSCDDGLDKGGESEAAGGQGDAEEGHDEAPVECVRGGGRVAADT